MDIELENILNKVKIDIAECLESCLGNTEKNIYKLNLGIFAAWLA